MKVKTMTRAIATADEFLQCATLDRQKIDVPVPELGDGKVIPVWGMTTRERTKWEDDLRNWNAKQKLQIRERLVVDRCRNDDGTQIFTLQHIEKLAEKRADVMERLVNVVQDACGFSNTDIETLAKKSQSDLDG
jgi:hypothetical protein